ncbi:MAG: 50S ribosomal protein L10 [Acidimicrobiales bacterium]|nr:50S ribosomal protein L10 [Acidimicrobiales bacterium]
MDNPRPEKVAVVEEVRGHFNDSDAAILTEYRGLTVTEISNLRRALRPAGGEYKVYKNTLVRFAARDLGLDIEPMLEGPTAIAFIKGDAVTVAKALRDFAKTNPKLVVKGGLLGDKVLDAKDTAALADVAPREVLLARLAGAMAAPMQQFAGLLQALPRNFAYGLKALIEQGGAPGAPASEPVADAAPAAEAEAPADNAAPAAEEAPADEATESVTNEAEVVEAEATPTETDESSESGAQAAAAGPEGEERAE